MSILRLKEKKKLFLECFEKRLGIVSRSCEDAGISRQTYYRWMEQDKKFNERVTDILEKQIDFVENQLISNIQDGDTTAIIFYLKTKGKKRGYIERQEITGKDGEHILSNLSNDELLKELSDLERKINP